MSSNAATCTFTYGTPTSTFTGRYQMGQVSGTVIDRNIQTFTISSQNCNGSSTPEVLQVNFKCTATYSAGLGSLTIDSDPVTINFNVIDVPKFKNCSTHQTYLSANFFFTQKRMIYFV